MLLNNALFTLALAAWILVLGVIAIYLVRTAQVDGVVAAFQRVFTERLVLLLLLVAVVITFVTNGVVFIEPNEVGVVVSLFAPRGYRNTPLTSGIHVIVPLLEHVSRFPTYYQSYTISSVPLESTRPADTSVAARTSDGQAVYIELTSIYSIDPAQVITVFLGWQDRYQEEFISPLIRGVVRSQVSQFTVDEVNSERRLELETDITNQLRDEMQSHGFLLNRFLLRNVTFSQEYANAVEEKQIAKQDVIRDAYKAQQTQLTSQAEADALDRLGQALARNPDVATLRYIEKLAPSITTMLVPNNLPFILPLPTAFSRQSAVPGATVTPAVNATATVTPTQLVPLPPTVQIPTPIETPDVVPVPTNTP